MTLAENVPRQDENVLTQVYTSVIGLVSGDVYNFRVYARNSVGLSPLTQVSILVA